MVNFPLSAWSPTSYQIVSHLRPAAVENSGYHPGSLKPDMLVKRRMSCRVALRVEFPSGGRVANRTDVIFDEHGVHSGSEPPGSCQLRYTAVAEQSRRLPSRSRA